MKRPSLSAFMTVWEALAWLAFGEIRPRSDTDEASLAKRPQKRQKADDEAIDRARIELREAAGTEKVKLSGQPVVNGIEPSADTEYGDIPAMAFMNDAITITDWGSVCVDPERPVAAVRWRGPTYRNVKMLASEVQALRTANLPPFNLQKARGILVGLKATGSPRPSREEAQEILLRHFATAPRDPVETILFKHWGAGKRGPRKAAK